MELYQGIILGIIQGLTEFLPVSSSGHLVLGQIFFGMTHSQLVFDISVHMGTLFAVVVVYFKDIRAIVISVLQFLSRLLSLKPAVHMIKEDENLSMAGLIILGSVPTALIGLGLKQIEHILFTSKVIVGCMLIVTGTLLWISRRYYDTGIESKPLNIKKGIWIGIVQGFAVIPGISRSGSTIAAGLIAGIDRDKAARFSFLLSIPAIIGAQILSIKDMIENNMAIDSVTVYAAIIAFITGFIALKLLLNLVHTGRFHLFAPYCWVMGALVLLSKLF